MKVIASLIVLISIAVVAQSGTPTLDGPCPDFKAIENIDGTKAAGTWYELYHGKVGIQMDQTKPEKKCKCIKKTITPTATGYNSTLTVVDESTGQQKTKKIVNTRKPGNKAVFTMKHEGTPEKDGFDFSKFDFTLSVVNTDYDNILLGVICMSNGSKHGYKFAALGRQKSYPAGELDRIKEVFKTHGVTGEFTPVDQSC